MMQDAYMVLGMNQGELKDDPLTGANPLRTIRGKVQPEKTRTMVEIALERVGIRLDNMKDRLQTLINNEKA